MKIICFVLSVALFSCESPNINYKDSESQTVQQMVEICHNPESVSHRERCTPQCFEPNLGQNSFCWTLKVSDCKHPREYQWQRESCHFFD